MEYKDPNWGTVRVEKHSYFNGALAISLECFDTDNGWEPLATLSVNMVPGSDTLPPNCFYVKDWSENEPLIAPALASGLFKVRDDLPARASGYVLAEVWELLDAPL